MRARKYLEMSNISKDVNILWDTITITLRMRRVSFERADLLGSLVGRSVGRNNKVEEYSAYFYK